jgi:hypothetical protein
MAEKPVPTPRNSSPDLVTVYKQNGRYHTGQRILHSHFGLGTVTQVRRNLIHVVLDNDQSQPKGKRERRFRSAVLTLRERMAANHFNHDDLETLFDMDREDFEEYVALLDKDIETDDSGEVA